LWIASLKWFGTKRRRRLIILPPHRDEIDLGPRSAGQPRAADHGEKMRQIASFQYRFWGRDLERRATSPLFHPAIVRAAAVVAADERLACRAAGELDIVGESAAVAKGTGGDPDERETRPAVWKRSMAKGDGAEAVAGIDAAAAWPAARPRNQRLPTPLIFREIKDSRP
jgi:hypothetical protein